MSSSVEESRQGSEAPNLALLAEIEALPDDLQTLKSALLGITVASVPEHALVSVRRSVEFIFQDIYSHVFRVPASKLKLAQMIEQLNKRKQLPARIFRHADFLRSVGNVGAHAEDGGPAAQADAISSMELGSVIGLTTAVVRWYVRAREAGEFDKPPAARDERPSANGPLAIEPKGLDSFGDSDSKYFLSLLPGRTDDNEVPESVRFWKTAIERNTPFTVGVIHGKSGCGKSSLVKAGLLPNLAASIKHVYVQATPDETAATLRARLLRQFGGLSSDLNLEEIIKALRTRAPKHSHEKPILSGDQKLVIVIDQFEQWLHARHEATDTELLHALKQCDGNRVLALIIVRDDFWDATEEFMKEMAQPLSSGENCRLVPLFDVDHARYVLAAYGRGCKKLGEFLTPEQEQFLDEVIKGLAREGRVICVRLALFAHLFEHRTWDLEQLKLVGGIEGIGSTFLDDKFNSSSSDTEKYRKHKNGAIAILQALLPAEGTEIKGQKRSAAVLMRAAHYEKRPQDFAQLLKYLDSELRLISPTSNEIEKTNSAEPGGPSDSSADDRYYQLTHDYLVPSLRKWLRSMLQKTIDGQATLLLNARTSNWKASRQQDAHHLPSLREYFIIRLWTDPHEWNDDQRSLMRHARKEHARTGIFAACVVAVLVALGLHWWNKSHAEYLANYAVSADIAEVPEAIKNLAGYRDRANPILRAILDAPPTAGFDADATNRRKLHAAMALLPIDPQQLDYLRKRMIEDDDIDVFPTLRDYLANYRVALAEPLWKTLEDTSEKAVTRFHAAWALASYARNDEKAAAARWEKSAPFVVEQMVDGIGDSESDSAAIVKLLEPARRHLLDALASRFRDPNQDDHFIYARILAEYAKDEPERLAELVAFARDAKAFEKLDESLSRLDSAGTESLLRMLDRKWPGVTKEEEASRKANTAVALFPAKPERVWPLLTKAPDPMLRSFLIDRLSRLHTTQRSAPAAIVKHLAVEKDPVVRQALILALGECRLRSEEGEFNKLLGGTDPRLLATDIEAEYQETADPGVRGAAEWTLRAFGREDRRARIDALLKRGDRDRPPLTGGRLWFVNAEGQTMVVVASAGSFKMGPAEREPIDLDSKREEPRSVTIDYPFAIGAHEVTLEEFLRWKKDHPYDKEHLKPRGDVDVRGPVNSVLWYEAAAYCNWLSQQDGIPEDQWCYQPNPETKQYLSGMRIAPNVTALQGYRLPTEAEWEYACRAGTFGFSRYYGEADELLVNYAWFGENSNKMLWPVGSKKPNALGLFDTLGNAIEWCQDLYQPDGQAAAREDDGVATGDQTRIMRGEKMLSLRGNIRVSRRDPKHRLDKPRDFICGFRVARTYRR